MYFAALFIFPSHISDVAVDTYKSIHSFNLIIIHCVNMPEFIDLVFF